MVNIPHIHPEGGHSLLVLAASKGGARLVASAVGLLALLLLAIFAFPARTVDADWLASENLEPTELVLTSGSIQIGKLAEFYWGGGTLRQLLDRLLLEGCTIDHISDLLWRRPPDDGGRWLGYKPQTAYKDAEEASRSLQQTIPNTISIGMLDDVPRARYIVRCIAGCGPLLGENYPPLASIADCPTQLDNLTPSKVHEDVHNVMRATNNKFSLPELEGPDTVREGDDLCWTLDHSEITAWKSDLITPYLAIHPGTCLLREKDNLALAETAWGYIRHSLKAPPVVVLIDTTDNTGFPAITENDDAYALIVHEYCHANQYWHIQRAWHFPTFDSLPDHIAEWWASWSTASRWWANATPAGRAFTKAVGMFWSNESESWIVNDPPFNSMYRTNPLELAAEVCTEYFAKLLEIDSKYAWVTTDGEGRANERLEGRVDWDPAEVLTESVVRWLHDYVLLPHVDLGLERRVANLGACQIDEPIREGQSCLILHAGQDTGQRFIVPEGGNGAAWSPCDDHFVHNLNPDRIKVDVLNDGGCNALPRDWTFQAERVHDAWYIRAVGLWKPPKGGMGKCEAGLSVAPGEYCTVQFLYTTGGEPKSRQARFLVYAVDELNESDTNPINPADRRGLYSHRGYAVLYHWPKRGPGDLEKPSADNNRLHHGCVQYPTAEQGQSIQFQAKKQRRDGAWKIIGSNKSGIITENCPDPLADATVTIEGLD